MKRPRLYSVGNPPHARMSQAPTLPSMQFSEASEGAELLQDEVSAVFLFIIEVRDVYSEGKNKENADEVARKW